MDCIRCSFFTECAVVFGTAPMIYENVPPEQLFTFVFLKTFLLRKHWFHFVFIYTAPNENNSRFRALYVVGHRRDNHTEKHSSQHLATVGRTNSLQIHRNLWQKQARGGQPAVREEGGTKATQWKRARTQYTLICGLRETSRLAFCVSVSYRSIMPSSVTVSSAWCEHAKLSQGNKWMWLSLQSAGKAVLPH